MKSKVTMDTVMPSCYDAKKRTPKVYRSCNAVGSTKRGYGMEYVQCVHLPTNAAAGASGNSMST